MKKGSVFADLAIDQGGCAETSHPTSHSDPVFEVDGVLQYCVPNVPALVPNTSTMALTNATLPYLQQLAGQTLEEAISASPALRFGVNTYQGMITSHPSRRLAGSAVAGNPHINFSLPTRGSSTGCGSTGPSHGTKADFG